MIDIDQLRRLAQEATPGPWKMLPVGDGRQKFAVADSEFLSILTVTDEGGATFGTVYDDADAKFIAAANPSAISELLDRLEAAERERDEFKRACFGHISDNSMLRAKIEATEKQEPVASVWRCDNGHIHGSCEKTLPMGAKLYALPGAQAQPAPSVPTESIGKMLAQVMEAAVANGANSVSMPDELVEVAAWLSGVQPNPANGQTRAVRDVIAERRRQIEVEGRAPEHDDRHGAHELAEAASCYCLSSAGKPFDYFETMWPWERWWFKVSDPRRDLVKAGALVLAEIERLDRAAAPKPEGE